MTDVNEKFEKGRKLIGKLWPQAAGGTKMSDEFVRHTVEHLFGDVWQNDALELSQRSLMTCAVLTALNREEEMKLHFQGAKNLGIERSAMEAMVTHVAHYAGWPNAMTGWRVLQEVWPQD